MSNPGSLSLQALVFMVSNFNEIPVESLCLIPPRARCRLFKLLPAADLCRVGESWQLLDVNSIWKELYQVNRVKEILSNATRKSNRLCMSSDINGLHANESNWKERYFNCLFHVALTNDAQNCHRMLCSIRIEDEEILNCFVSNPRLHQVHTSQIFVPARYNSVSSITELVCSIVVGNLHLLPTALMLSDQTLPNLVEFHNLTSNDFLSEIRKVIIETCKDCELMQLMLRTVLDLIFKNDNCRISHLDVSIDSSHIVHKYLIDGGHHHLSHFAVTRQFVSQATSNCKLKCIGDVLSCQQRLSEVELSDINIDNFCNAETVAFTRLVCDLFNRTHIRSVALQSSSLLLVKSVLESFWSSPNPNHLILKGIKCLSPLNLNTNFKYCQKKSLSIIYCTFSMKGAQSIFPSEICLNYLSITPLLPNCECIKALIDCKTSVVVDEMKLVCCVSAMNFDNVNTLFTKVIARQWYLNFEFYDEIVYRRMLDSIDLLVNKQCVLICCGLPV